MSFLDEIKNKVSETAKTAVKKSNDVVEITKLSVSITDARSSKDKVYKEIGNIVYDSYKAGEIFDETIINKCRQIDDIDENISNMKNKIAQLKNIKVCPECGKENDVNASFCSNCGTNIKVIDEENNEKTDNDESYNTSYQVNYQEVPNENSQLKTENEDTI